MEHVVVIEPSGAVRAMHNDKFSLSFMGIQVIVRASEIKWNEEAQNWEIWFRADDSFLMPYRVYQTFPSYETARDFEVLVMNECMKQGKLPTDYDILDWAEAMRNQ